MRQCGECSVCCTVGAVPELKKPAHTPCSYIKTSKCGSCSIHDKPELPSVCSQYKCSWLRGYGTDEDRPDKIDVMFSDNFVEGQRYFTAIETSPKAIFKPKAKHVWKDIARKTNIPIIVVKYGVKPPHDTGDYIIVTEKTLPRCSRIIGKAINADEDFEWVIVYELIKGK